MLIPESPAFIAMEAMQREVDDQIQRKKSEIREAMLLPEPQQRKLRLTVSNTHARRRHGHLPHHPHEDQHSSKGTAPSGPGASSSETGCWTLLIGGSVLDPEPAAASTSGQAGGASAASVARAPGFGSGALPPAAAAASLGGFNINPFLPGGSTAGSAMGLSLPPPVPPTPPAPVAPKFPATFYFRRVEVQLDPAQYPGEEGHFVWDKVCGHSQ